MLTILLLFFSIPLILTQNQSSCPNVTLRALDIGLPTNHEGIWVAPFNATSDMIAVLITNVKVDNGSRFYVVNASANCPNESQVHVETHFNNQYQFTQLYVVDDLDGDYFASLLYERATGKEYIGMFQMYSHGPETLFQGGMRTRISQDIEAVCRPCILAGLMTAKKTWVIQQINFLSKAVFYNYTLPFQIDDVYMLNMMQDSAAGSGLSSYFLTLAAITNNAIQLVELNMGNNSVVFKSNFTTENPIQSINTYHGEVFSITTVDNKLQLLDMTNGTILKKFTLGYATNLVVDCAIVYPNIACRNVVYLDSQRIPPPLITFWTYTLPLPTQPIETEPTCLGQHTFTDAIFIGIRDLVAYPGQNEFIVATKDYVYIYAPNTTTDLEAIL